MTNNCGDGFRSQFASIPGVAVWAVLPGALVALTSEVGTDLGRQILGKDICGFDFMFGEKGHAHVCDMALLGWVASTNAAGLLLALDGSRFCTLVWGGRITLHIVALILDVFWKGKSRNGSCDRGTELVPGLLVENLDTVAAMMGMGLFVDCVRVSWSSNAFKLSTP
jgi:hypothetical protein